MTDYRSLNHTKWACQYHVVFIPKYRKKVIYTELRRYLGDVLRRLAQRRESEVEEGHLMIDHVHLMLSIPPKYSVADVIGYIKGKSAIHIARNFAGRPRNFVGQHFWAPGRVNALRQPDSAFTVAPQAGDERGRAIVTDGL